MSKDVAALDFTTNSIQVLVLRRSGARQCAEAILPAEAIADGRILQPAAVQLYLARFFRDLKLRRVEARLALSDTACVSRFVRFPKMRASDLDRSLHFEADRELPMSRRDAYIGWQVIDGNGAQQTVLLVGAWRDMVEGYLDAVEGLGKVAVIEPRSLSLARAVGLSEVIVMDWTGDRLQVVVVDEGRVSYTTTVPVSDDARQSPRRIAHALISLIPKQFGPRMRLPGRVVFLGDLAGRQDVATELSASARTPFEVIIDWCPPDGFADVTGTKQAANIGLLMRNGHG